MGIPARYENSVFGRSKTWGLQIARSGKCMLPDPAGQCARSSDPDVLIDVPR